MVVAIAEIIDVVPHRTVFQVEHCAVVSALASASEICFQRGCPRVQDRERVSVVSPHVPEHRLELLIVEQLKRTSFRLSNLLKLEQLQVEYLSRNHALDYISSVETIHAVGPDDSLLQTLNFARFLIDSLSLVQSHFQLTLEKSEVV